MSGSMKRNKNNKALPSPRSSWLFRKADISFGRFFVGLLVVLLSIGTFGCKKKGIRSKRKRTAPAKRRAIKANFAKSDDQARRALTMKPAARRAAASRAPMAEPERKAAGKKKDKKKKPKAQVWQRTEKGTVLSKVSVGGKKYLQLKKLRVTVQVQGSRVRTVMDHIYYNPYHRTLQGTFKYTLPADASVSYYAMFVGQRRRSPRFFTGKGVPSRRQLVRMAPQLIARRSPKKDWGILREARLVGAEKGREVYENITRRRIDPALLEQDAPNTFTGRVFPIRSRGYNRIIIAYEQTLPQLQGEQVYRFRFPKGVADSIDFSMDYDAKSAKLTRHNLRKIRCRARTQKNFLRCYWEQNKPDRDAIFYFKPAKKQVAWSAGSDPMDSSKYLYAQLRAKLPIHKAATGAKQAIFLMDTSLSENASHFGANVALLKKILLKNKGIQRFNILFFDVSGIWANPKGWLKNTPTQRKRVFARINKILLEGATNFGSAIQTLAHPNWLKTKKLPLDVFLLSDGQLSWGERQMESIMAQFKRKSHWGQVRFFAYQMGIGSENAALYRRLTRKGGAVFQCLGRAELDRCAIAHTRQSMLLTKVKIEGIGAKEILVAGRQANIFPGSLITIASRFQRNGKAKVTLEGFFQGQKVKIKYVIPVKARGDLAPRAWAELAIAQLSALEDPAYTKLIIAYSQHFRIPNKHCSFLVLETDKEYKQYGLDKLKKGNRVQDVATFIDTILSKKGRQISARTRWIALLRKGMLRANMLQQSSGRAVMQLLNQLPIGQFTFQETIQDRLWTKGMSSLAYQQKRQRDRNDFSPFVKEAKKRLVSKSVSGAVRALSSIVELHPSDPRALRLVGYYLLSWQRPTEAARVFLRVLERRSYEPHSYRDLARSLIKLERYGLAAALYEIILDSTWDNRFGMIKQIAKEEYALLLQQGLLGKKTKGSERSWLRRRQSMRGLQVKRSKIRVTLTWNTDNTDIDLWVTEPTGEKCGYSNRRTYNGGRLLQDITRGYGPERYENRSGRSGHYRVRLKFYGNSSNTFGNETHASVMVLLNAGTPQQMLIEKNLVLRRTNDSLEVISVKL